MPTQRFSLESVDPSVDEEGLVARMRAIPGVLYAVASTDQKWMDVEFDDDHLAPEDLRAALEALGYSVRLAG